MRSRRRPSCRRSSPTRRSIRRRRSACSASCPRDRDELVHNFLRLIAAKGRAGQIPGIRDEFQALVDRAQGRVAVELTTAFELSDDEAASIVAQIEQSSGRKVEATRKVDPELVGGMILQAGSLRVDASVRGRLERLRHELATR